MNEIFQQLGDLFSPVFHYLFAVPRLGTLFFLFPLFGSRTFNGRVRATAVFVLALAVGPMLEAPPLPTTPMDVAGFVLSELGIGLLLGMAVRVITSIVHAASGIFAGQAGFSIASQLDPLTGETSLVPATFHILLATTLFFTADFHHLLLAGVVDSYRLMPVGGFLDAIGASAGAGQALGTLFFEMAIALAGPALLLTVTFDLLMLLAGKAMPQAPILIIAYPVKVAVGLIGMIILSFTLGHGLSGLADAVLSTFRLFG